MNTLKDNDKFNELINDCIKPTQKETLAAVSKHIEKNTFMKFLHGELMEKKNAAAQTEKKAPSVEPVQKQNVKTNTL
jgi:hypothetical protein